MDDDEYFKELLEKACRTLDDVAEDVRNNLSSAVKNIIKAGKALQEGRDLHPSNLTLNSSIRTSSTICT